MKKSTFMALGVFAVLGLAVFLTREPQSVNVGVPRFSLPALGEVTGISVSGAHKAELKLEGGKWTVSGHAADEGLVKAALDALKDFKAGDFVTEKVEKHAELEVDEAKGTVVVLTAANGQGWNLVFGKAAKSGGTYVREKGNNAVFVTQSPAPYQLKREVSAWRNKAIATAPVADVAKVTVQQGESRYALVGQADGGWELDPPPAKDFRFDPSAAARLVGQLSSLRAQDFAEAESAPPVAALTAELKSGKALKLELGPKRPEGTSALKLEGDPQVYLVQQWTADALNKSVEDLRDTTLMAFEPEKVTKLAINAGGKSTVLAKDGASWKVVEPKTLPAGFEFEPQSVTAVLARYKTLRAAKVVPGVNDKSAGLAKPSASLELALEGGGKQSLRLGGELPTKELYAKGSADGLTYAIGAQEKASLEQGLELFKKRPPPDPSQMRGLDQLPPEVRKQLEAQLRQRQGGQ